jgi:hypothetical protein
VARLGLVRLVTGDRRPPLVFDDPFVTLDDARAGTPSACLRSIATDFQVIYLTTSSRYDEAADAVVVLDGPTAADVGADATETALEGVPVAVASAAVRAPATGRRPDRARRAGDGHRHPRPPRRRGVGLW